MDKFANETFTPESVVILDTKENENSDAHAIEGMGVKVIGRKRWDGEVPEGSFIFINPFMRMSTAEFYFFRKSCEMSHEDAMELACTLMSHYNTHMTTPELMEGEVERKEDTHTTFDMVREYLRRINPCEEKDKALSALYDAVPYLEGYERACEKFCE